MEEFYPLTFKFINILGTYEFFISWKFNRPNWNNKDEYRSIKKE